MADGWTNLLKGYNRYVRPNFSGKFLSKNFCHLKLKSIIIIKKCIPTGKSLQNLSLEKDFDFQLILSFLNTPMLWNIYLVKATNTRKRCEIYSLLAVKKPEWRDRCRCDILIVNLEYISHLFLVFLLLTLNK